MNDPSNAAQSEMIKFLCGEDSLEGVWFCEDHPTRGGRFWWRSLLRERFPAPTPQAEQRGDEIDDDVFKYDNADMSQCISGFGRNAIRAIQADLETARIPRQMSDDEYADARERIDWHINELVKWCRHFNGKSQALARQSVTLAEALAPFAKVAGLALADLKDNDRVVGVCKPGLDFAVRVKDFRAAASALSSKGTTE